MIRTQWIKRHYIEKAVREFLRPADTVIEIGSGMRWRYSDNSLTINRDADAQPDLVCDAENLPITDQSVDDVLALEVLEHTANPDKLVAEIYRILKPGGRFLITVPFLLSIHADEDYRRYTEKGLHLLLRDFHNVQIVSQGGKWSVIATLLRSNIFGIFLFPLINNIGDILDKILSSSVNPNDTLGYSATGSKPTSTR